MKLNDAILLSVSKIKTRKLRTIMSVVTISILFGVIISAFFIVSGLKISLENSANKFQDGKIYLNASQSMSSFNDQEIMDRAIELYKLNSSPNKEYPLVTTYPSGEPMEEPYLDKNNVFAIQATDEYREKINKTLEARIAEKITNHNASATPIETYSIRADSIHIDNNHTLSNSGSSLIYLSQDIITPLIQVSNPDTDAIPIILPTDIAGQIIGLGQLSASATSKQKKDYTTAVRGSAIGHTYTATIQNESSEQNVKYQIVGLLPSLGSLRIAKKSNEFHILDLILNNLGASSSPFIVADTSSKLFTDTYTTSDVYSVSANYLLEFTDTKQAADFKTKYSCTISENHCQDFYVEEILNNHINIYEVFNIVDALLIIFVVFFSIVAIIIMTSTLSRIFDDERQSIALYRSMGASSKDIAQIYAYYIFLLCTLTCIAAIIIGLALAIFASILSASDLSSNLEYFYGINTYANASLLGFDPRILLIIITIFAVGGFCFLLISDKLTSKNIVKNLKS